MYNLRSLEHYCTSIITDKLSYADMNPKEFRAHLQGHLEIKQA